MAKTYLWMESGTETYVDSELDFGTISNPVFFSNPFALGQGKVNESAMDKVIFPEPDGAQSDKAGRDTSSLKIGERGVINPLWQYTKYADPRTAGATGVNYGRVYNQTIRAHNPIVFIQPGRPKFNATSGFLSKGILGSDSKSNDLKKALVSESLFEGSGPGIFDLSTLMQELQAVSGNYDNPMKFYDFKPNWNTYKHYVSAITEELQIRMGITEMYKDKKYSMYYTKNGGKGVDILTRFQSFYGFLDSAAGKSGDSSAEVQSGFLPFRVEKSTDAGESFSNNSGESSFASLTKQIPDVAKEARFLTDNTNGFDSGNIFGSLLQSATDAVFEGTTAVTGSVFSGATEIIKSGGNLMFPDIWKESTYTKSLNIVIKLHAPYADPVCYYETILFPLACLLALSLPEQMEGPVYASPPLVRIRSRGWFSCDMGLVESISIKRGADKNDWTINRLPRSVEVTLNIKDLYGTMVMSLMGQKGMKFFAKDNTALRDYLNTIGGLDTFSETRFGTKLSNWFKSWQRKWQKIFDPVNMQQGLQNVVSKFTPLINIQQNFFK